MSARTQTEKKRHCTRCEKDRHSSRSAGQGPKRQSLTMSRSTASGDASPTTAEMLVEAPDAQNKDPLSLLTRALRHQKSLTCSSVRSLTEYAARGRASW